MILEKTKKAVKLFSQNRALYKIKSIKKRCLVTFLLLLIYLPINSQSLINRTVSNIPSYLTKKDVKEAEKIIASINQESLDLEPDSIRYLFHYYAAAVEEIKNRNTYKKSEHLKKAKLYLETLPSLGIGCHSYPEVCYALGQAYQELNNSEEALNAWEDGISKCLSVFRQFDTSQKEYFFNMVKGLADIYEKKGDKEYAMRLRSAVPEVDTQSFDYVTDLISKSISLINNNKAEEALIVLNEAEVLLPKTKEPGYELLYAPIYSRKSSAFSKLGKFEETKENLKLLKEFSGKYSEENWQKRYISDINVCAVYFADNEDFEHAIELINYSKSENFKLKLSPDSTTNRIERSISKLYNIKLETDSLENLLSEENDIKKWVSIGFKIIDIHVRYKKYFSALNKSIQVYNKIKTDSTLAEESIKALKTAIDCAIVCKEYDKAYPFILKYEDFILRKYGDHSNEYAQIMNQHAIVTMESKPNEALLYLDKAYRILVEKYGDESQNIISILHNKGRLFLLKKKYDEAYELLKKAKDLQLKYMGKVIPNTQKYLSEVEHELSIRL